MIGAYSAVPPPAARSTPAPAAKQDSSDSSEDSSDEEEEKKAPGKILDIKMLHFVQFLLSYDRLVVVNHVIMMVLLLLDGTDLDS